MGAARTRKVTIDSHLTRLVAQVAGDTTAVELRPGADTDVRTQLVNTAGTPAAWLGGIQQILLDARKTSLTQEDREAVYRGLIEDTRLPGTARWWATFAHLEYVERREHADHDRISGRATALVGELGGAEEMLAKMGPVWAAAWSTTRNHEMRFMPNVASDDDPANINALHILGLLPRQESRKAWTPSAHRDLLARRDLLDAVRAQSGESGVSFWLKRLMFPYSKDHGFMPKYVMAGIEPATALLEVLETYPVAGEARTWMIEMLTDWQNTYFCYDDDTLEPLGIDDSLLERIAGLATTIDLVENVYAWPRMIGQGRPRPKRVVKAWRNGNLDVRRWLAWTGAILATNTDGERTALTPDVAMTLAEDSTLAELTALRAVNELNGRSPLPGSKREIGDADDIAALARICLAKAPARTWRKVSATIAEHNAWPARMPVTSVELLEEIAAHGYKHGSELKDPSLPRRVAAVLFAGVATTDGITGAEFLDMLDLSEHGELVDGIKKTYAQTGNPALPYEALAPVLPLGGISMAARDAARTGYDDPLLQAWAAAAADLTVEGWTLAHADQASKYSLKRIKAATATSR